MLTCRDVTGLLSDGLERPLTWREKLSLRMHTLMCRSCRNYARQLPFMRQAMRQYARGRIGRDTDTP